VERAMVRQRQEIEPHLLRPGDLCADRHIALGPVLGALPGQAAVARMIVVHMQVAPEPGQLPRPCLGRRRAYAASQNGKPQDQASHAIPLGRTDHNLQSLRDSYSAALASCSFGGTLSKNRTTRLEEIMKTLGCAALALVLAAPAFGQAYQPPRTPDG